MRRLLAQRARDLVAWPLGVAALVVLATAIADRVHPFPPIAWTGLVAALGVAGYVLGFTALPRPAGGRAPLLELQPVSRLGAWAGCVVPSTLAAGILALLLVVPRALATASVPVIEWRLQPKVELHELWAGVGGSFALGAVALALLGVAGGALVAAADPTDHGSVLVASACAGSAVHGAVAIFTWWRLAPNLADLAPLLLAWTALALAGSALAWCRFPAWHEGRGRDVRWAVLTSAVAFTAVLLAIPVGLRTQRLQADELAWIGSVLVVPQRSFDVGTSAASEAESPGGAWLVELLGERSGRRLLEIDPRTGAVRDHGRRLELWPAESQPEGDVVVGVDAGWLGGLAWGDPQAVMMPPGGGILDLALSVADAAELGASSRMTVSPDLRWIAFIESDAGGPAEHDVLRISAVVSPSGGVDEDAAARRLPAREWPVASGSTLTWTGTGRLLVAGAEVVAREEGGRRPLRVIDWLVDPVSGRRELMERPARLFAHAANGRAAISMKLIRDDELVRSEIVLTRVGEPPRTIVGAADLPRWDSVFAARSAIASAPRTGVPKSEISPPAPPTIAVDADFERLVALLPRIDGEMTAHELAAIDLASGERVTLVGEEALPRVPVLAPDRAAREPRLVVLAADGDAIVWCDGRGTWRTDTRVAARGRATTHGVGPWPCVLPTPDGWARELLRDFSVSPDGWTVVACTTPECETREVGRFLGADRSPSFRVEPLRGVGDARLTWLGSDHVLAVGSRRLVIVGLSRPQTRRVVFEHPTVSQ